MKTYNDAIIFLSRLILALSGLIFCHYPLTVYGANEDQAGSPKLPPRGACGSLFIDQLVSQGKIKEAHVQRLVEQMEVHAQTEHLPSFEKEFNRIWFLVPERVLQNQATIRVREADIPVGKSYFLELEDNNYFEVARLQYEPEVFVVNVRGRFILNGKPSPFYKKLDRLVGTRGGIPSLREVVKNGSQQSTRYLANDQWIGDPPVINAQSEIRIEFVIDLSKLMADK